jgi:hypothetical protein
MKKAIEFRGCIKAIFEEGALLLAMMLFAEAKYKCATGRL